MNPKGIEHGAWSIEFKHFKTKIPHLTSHINNPQSKIYNLKSTICNLQIDSDAIKLHNLTLLVGVAFNQP